MSAPKPRKPRPAPVSVRLNAHEKIILRERAAGMPVSTYLKQAALGSGVAASSGRNRPVIDRVMLARLLAALGGLRLAADLAALADAARSGSLLVTAAVEEQIGQARRDLAGMREALLTALGVRGLAESKAELAAVFNQATAETESQASTGDDR